MNLIPRTLLWIILSAGVLATAGCGNKGELFLPESQPASESDDSEDEESSK